MRTVKCPFAHRFRRRCLNVCRLPSMSQASNCARCSAIPVECFHLGHHIGWDWWLSRRDADSTALRRYPSAVYCCCCRSVLHFVLGSLDGIAGKHTAMDIGFSGIRGHRMDCQPNGDSLRCARTTATVRPHLLRPPSTCHSVRPSVGNAHCNRCNRKSILRIHELPGAPPADRGIFPNSSPPPLNNGRFATSHMNNHGNRPLSLKTTKKNGKWENGCISAIVCLTTALLG